MDWIVYKHTNLVNGLIYIGITCQGIEKRWQAGYRGNPHFYNANMVKRIFHMKYYLKD